MGFYIYWGYLVGLSGEALNDFVNEQVHTVDVATDTPEVDIVESHEPLIGTAALRSS